MNREYLFGLRALQSGLPGIYLVQDHRNKNSSRVLGTYYDLKLNKATLFETMRVFGQEEDPKEWQMHHIVERQHFADVDIRGLLSMYYWHDLPCVMIHNGSEHDAYNRLMRTKESKNHFLPYRASAPKRQADRSIAISNKYEDAMAKGGRAKAEFRSELKDRLTRLASLYDSFYLGDPVLGTIASNVFNRLYSRI